MAVVVVATVGRVVVVVQVIRVVVVATAVVLAAAVVAGPADLVAVHSGELRGARVRCGRGVVLVAAGARAA